MTLNVPLTVRVGSKFVTREISGMTIRREVTGVKSISLRANRPLDRFDPDFAALSKVSVFDGRSAATVADGRLSDGGRSVGNDGQVWEMIARGPAAAAEDMTAPIVFIDRSISEGWAPADSTGGGSSVSIASAPGDGTLDPAQGMLITFADGTPVVNLSRQANRYFTVSECGQKLGGYQFSWDTGLTDANWLVQAVTRDGGGGEAAHSVGWNVAGGTASRVVVTDFPNGRDMVEVRGMWNGGASGVTGDTTWLHVTNMVVRAMLHTKAGAEITTGYTTGYVLAHNVVEEVLSSMLPEFDGANATVDATAAFQIKHLIYPDGVNAAQIFADLMALEPAFRWTTGPDLSGNGYQFIWEPWPTTVRYEATLGGGASFPISTQDLYNQVVVRWRDASGRVRSNGYIGSSPTLSDAGVTRQAVIDLGGEAGTQESADEAGANFLADHAVPKNAGNLTIDRPIRDLATGRMVQPWEIEAGELIRVRGVESYPDALNASSNDGLTVFRIWTSTYTSESNSATLELDADELTTTNALASLMGARPRKR